MMQRRAVFKAFLKCDHKERRNSDLSAELARGCIIYAWNLRAPCRTLRGCMVPGCSFWAAISA